MRLLKLIGALVLCISLHAVGVHLTETFSRAVDLLLVLTVARALRSTPVTAMLIGALAGWLLDGLSGGPLGLYGIADTVTGFVTAVAAQRLVIERGPGVFAAAAVAALVQQLVLAALAALFLPTAETPSLAWAAVKMLTTGVLVVLGRGLASRLGHRWGELRRARSSRLRFD